MDAASLTGAQPGEAGVDTVNTVNTGEAGVDTTRLARALWRENTPLAEAALGHRFVLGLGDGTLPRCVFQQYIAQDAFFLEAFSRAYALALARSPDRAGLHDFSVLLAGVQDELRLHEGYAARWGVQLEGVVPAAATSHYTDFLLKTASLGTVGEVCAAMTPCMRLYAYLGQSLAARASVAGTANPYAEWIRTYADPGFEALAATLEALLHRYAQDAPNVRVTYRRAMELELAFFEASAATHPLLSESSSR